MSKLSIKKKAQSNRIAIPMIQTLEKGNQVYWSGDNSDPKDIYVIRGIQGNIVFLINSEGNEVEAFNYEVQKV